MGLISSRRGIFFTASAIIFLSVLLVYGLLNTPTSSQISQLSSTNRLTSLNQFVQNVETDASYAVYTVGFRSLIGMIQHLEYYGAYLPNSVYNLTVEMFLNGSLASNKVYVLENSTLTNWLQTISNKSLSLGLDFNHTLNSIYINQSDPWHIQYSINFSFLFHDNRSNSTWNRTILTIAKVDITGFVDPLFVVETGNEYVREINKTPYSGIYVVGNNASNLITHMQRGYYAAFDGAPNYLMRLVGNMTGAMDGTGIESIIDKDALSLFMTVNNALSNSDYLYFSGSSITVYSFGNMPASFRLDNISGGAQRHIPFYQLTS